MAEKTNKERLRLIEEAIQRIETTLASAAKSLEYQVKLTEEMYTRMNDGQANYRRMRSNVSAMRKVFANNPMIKGNPQAESIFNTMMDSISETMDK